MNIADSSTGTVTPVEANVSTEQPPDGGATQQPEQVSEKTFTQADIDRIVKDRVQRVKAQYSDYDEKKAAADKLKQIEDAQKSELEKLQARLAETESLAKERESQLRTERQARLVAKIAGNLGGIDPYDANFTLATQAIDPDSDGAEDIIKGIIEGMLKTKPYLFRSKSGGVEPFNPGNASGAAEHKETDNERRFRLYSQGGSIWDDKRQGGVIFSHPEDAKRKLPL